MDKNEALSIILKDLQTNREFGSLFQFWVELVESELDNNLCTMELDVHNLAVNVIKRIAQISE